MCSVSSFQPQHLPQADVLKVLPFERGPCLAASRDPPWPAGFLEDCVKGLLGLLHTLALTALLTWSPGIDQTQDRDSGQQDPGSLLFLQPTAPSRQPCPCSPHPSPAHPLIFPQACLGLILPSSSKAGVNPGRCCVFMRLPLL